MLSEEAKSLLIKPGYESKFLNFSNPIFTSLGSHSILKFPRIINRSLSQICTRLNGAMCAYSAVPYYIVKVFK